MIVAPTIFRMKIANPSTARSLSSVGRNYTGQLEGPNFWTAAFRSGYMEGVAAFDKRVCPDRNPWPPRVMPRSKTPRASPDAINDLLESLACEGFAVMYRSKKQLELPEVPGQRPSLAVGPSALIMISVRPNHSDRVIWLDTVAPTVRRSPLYANSLDKETAPGTPCSASASVCQRRAHLEQLYRRENRWVAMRNKRQAWIG